MLQRTTARALPLLNRTSELAPAAQACCGVCRSCMSTNLFTAAAAGIATAVAYGRRLVRRSA